MPSHRRRSDIRPSNVPARTVSYRPSSAQGTESSPLAPQPFDRFALLSQFRTSKTIGTPQALPADATVTVGRLSLTLPVPPSINRQYATVNGRRLLSSTGRAYKTQVGQQVWIALAQSPARASLMTQLQSGSLALSIRFFFTSALRRDIDGGLKIAQDALCEGLGVNDNRIVETHLYKDVDKARPRIEVSLSIVPVSPEPVSR
jgi:crossover junction endodeoxyribonuclease RusA